MKKTIKKNTLDKLKKINVIKKPNTFNFINLSEDTKNILVKNNKLKTNNKSKLIIRDAWPIDDKIFEDSYEILHKNNQNNIGVCKSKEIKTIAYIANKKMNINSLEGKEKCRKGDYIIEDGDNNLYVISKEDFLKNWKKEE